ncbi:MAG TPA: SCP2 sterol-binding domain-containing protein [Ktedonobacterales bacterium]|nr:SCP2 sterol-binding domain-containing protein [Ktedonobacterales bacterium]
MADPLTTIPGSFEGLQQAFLPAKAAGVSKTVQFDFTGAEAGTWTLIVRDGTLSYHQGPAENPNATVSVDSEDWLKLLRGELNGMTAFTTGKLKVKGDMMLVAQFQTWFQPPS